MSGAAATADGLWVEVEAAIQAARKENREIAAFRQLVRGAEAEIQAEKLQEIKHEHAPRDEGSIDRASIFPLPQLGEGYSKAQKAIQGFQSKVAASPSRSPPPSLALCRDAVSVSIVEQGSEVLTPDELLAASNLSLTLERSLSLSPTKGTPISKKPDINVEKNDDNETEILIEDAKEVPPST